MIVYKCDICKKIYENEKLIKMQVPINDYHYATNNGIKLAKFKNGIKLSNIEICSSCASHIADFWIHLKSPLSLDVQTICRK